MTATEAAGMTGDGTTHMQEGAPELSVREALLSRRSTRAFLPNSVPQPVVQRILTLAASSASNSNSQPWHVHVLTGAAKNRLSTALLHA
ncbi:MAG TPA: nitroreductase family protein, partial [Yinghuangia sp.]|nr:nitroreductase family protein [Yinghuangia sp.]